MPGLNWNSAICSVVAASIDVWGEKHVQQTVKYAIHKYAVHKYAIHKYAIHKYAVSKQQIFNKKGCQGILLTKPNDDLADTYD